MSIKQPFRPSGGATVNIDVSSSSQRVALTSGEQQRIMNNGSATVWLKFGDSSVTATTSDIPVGATPFTEVQSPPPGTTHVAVIAAAATGKIYFTPGTGI